MCNYKIKNALFRLCGVLLVVSTFTSACSKQESNKQDASQIQSISPDSEILAESPPTKANLTESPSSVRPMGQSASQLNDTGITWAGNYPRDNNEGCEASINQEAVLKDGAVGGDILAQQDCMRGGDVTRKNPQDGSAGFVYRKISDQGERLSAAAESWSCVLDEITGLLWEVKKPMDSAYGNDGLHDGDDLFTWYSNNQSANGGAVGDWNNQLNVCAGYTEEEPKTFCNTEEFTRRVNDKGLCGFKDWRVPSRFELESLVNYGNKAPSIDTVYFPNTSAEFYWSSSPAAKDKNNAWAVNFRSNNTSTVSRQGSFPVRLVRDWTSSAE